MGLNRKPFEGSRLNRKPRKDEPAFHEQERRLAASIPEGKLTPGSGCGTRPSRKGDAVGTYFRGEAKTTSNMAGITIYRDDLQKIEHEARTTQKIPCLTFGFDAGRYDWTAFPQDKAAKMCLAIHALLEGDTAGALAAAELVRP
jgi:hypothetical protein